MTPRTAGARACSLRIGIRINTRGQAEASCSKTGGTAPISLLVPQVKLPKRLDLDRNPKRAHNSVPRLIVANWVERRMLPAEAVVLVQAPIWFLVRRLKSILAK